jgi:HK97 family phage portal protein
VGISVREQLLSTIQGNVKAQALLNRMYDNGMTAKAVLNYTGSLNDANVTTLIAQVKEYIKSSDKKSVESIIPMPVGMSLTPLNLKLADSQFLEIKQYTALQIASAFGVKPYQVGDYTKSSYASAEAQQLSFLVDTLLYIVKHYEEEIGYKLLSSEEEADGYHAKLNTAVIVVSSHCKGVGLLIFIFENFHTTFFCHGCMLVDIVIFKIRGIKFILRLVITAEQESASREG